MDENRGVMFNLLEIVQLVVSQILERMATIPYSIR